MLKWVARQVQQVRIALDLPRFERLQLVEHLEAAERLFDTTALDQAARDAMAPFLIEERLRFDGPIAVLTREVCELNAKKSVEEKLLSFLKRGFTEELEQAHGELGSLKAQQRIAAARRRRNLTKLRDVSSDVAWWYRRSQGEVFDGDRVPSTYRYVGTSKSDVERLKARKKQLKMQLDDCRRELDAVSGAIARAGVMLGSIKADRDRARSLKRDGASVLSLSHSIRLIGNAIAAKAEEAAALEKERVEFLQNAIIRSGAQAIKDEVLALKFAKKVYVKEFCAEESKRIRVEAHRRQWLQDRPN